MCTAKSAFVSFLRIGEVDDKEGQDVEAGYGESSFNASTGEILTRTWTCLPGHNCSVCLAYLGNISSHVIFIFIIHRFYISAQVQRKRNRGCSYLKWWMFQIINCIWEFLFSLLQIISILVCCPCWTVFICSYYLKSNVSKPRAQSEELETKSEVL